MKRICLFGVLAFVACKPKLDLDPRRGYIIGANNMEKASSANTAGVPAQNKRSFVLISTTKADQTMKFCSGVIVDSETAGGPLRVMANHHCFADEDSSGKVSQTIFAEACIKTKIYLGYYADQLKTVTSANCKPGSLRTNFPADLSILTLDSKVDAEPLHFAAPENVFNRKAYVVHFPDVPEDYVASSGGGLNLPVAVITKDDCASQDAFPVTDWGLDPSLPMGVRHTCDIIHGSSGSALVDANTNEILGIDWGGIKIKRDGQDQTYNVATRAEFGTMMMLKQEDKINQFYADARQKAADAKSDDSDKSAGLAGCSAKAATAHTATRLEKLQTQMIVALVSERGSTLSRFAKKYQDKGDAAKFWVASAARDQEWDCAGKEVETTQKMWCATMAMKNEVGLVSTADTLQKTERQEKLSQEESAVLQMTLEMKAKRYSETLRILSKMAQGDEKYRFIHDQMQELYAARQKGEGKALLRQN